MYLPTLLSTAALALTANAFLIPPEIADKAQAVHHAGAEQLHKAKAKAGEIVPQIVDHNSYDIKLDCASCPFALKSERSGVHEWTNDVESDLLMHFAAKDDQLTLNGKPFYPITPNKLPGLLYTPQVRKASEDGKGLEGYDKDLKLSYTLEFETNAETEEDSLIDIKMTVLGIDGQMVKIDDVDIKVNKHKADGVVSIYCQSVDTVDQTDVQIQLSILSVDTVARSPNDPDAKCPNMPCRVMAKLGAAIAHARAKAALAAHKAGHAAHKVKCFCMRCFQRLAGHPAALKPSGDAKSTKLPTHNVFRPGHLRPQHHGGHKHHHGGMLHSVMGFARHIFTFVILPVMVGVAVGITASAIGMLVGQAVVFLWLKYRRSGNATYDAVQTDDKEDSLPAYEDESLPAYTEGETVVVAVDEKEQAQK